MPDSTAVHLTQCVLWYDSTRIHTWPDLLAKIGENEIARSPTDFGRKYHSERMTDNRHSSAEKLTRNLPGIEVSRSGKVTHRGIGLLERCTGGYRLSLEGRALAAAYRSGDDSWTNRLAVLLATREPRIRSLLLAIGQVDDGLVVDDRLNAGVIKTVDRILRPFAKSMDQQQSFRDYVNSRAKWAMGSWLDTDAITSENISLAGAMGDTWSLHDFGLAFRSALAVFEYVGILVPTDSGWRLNADRACDVLGADIASDFNWTVSQGEFADPIETLHGCAESLRGPTGHIVASELRSLLQEHGFDNPDRLIAGLERDGRILIYGTDHGQSRHGVGLYKDPRRQLIKIRFLEQGIHRDA